MHKFCALCGRETDVLIEGLCPDCYRKTHPLVRVKRDYVGIVRCSSCGAVLYKGRWVRDYGVIEKLILESLQYLGKVSSSKIEDFELKPGFTTAVVKVRGTVHELISEYEEEVLVRVRYTEELCPRCRDLIIEKERAIVQIRSAIPMSDQVKKLIMDIIKKETVKDTERSGFLKVEELREGFDIKLSDQGLARAIAYRIHRTLPSRVLESQSVVKGRGDKVITKLTISVTIVPIGRGSVIMYANRPHLVLGYSQGNFKMLDLSSNNVLNVKINDLIRNGITVPEYKISCVETGGARALEIVINDKRYIVNNVC